MKKTPEKYRCPKCEITAEVTVPVLAVGCWRCRKAMRQVQDPSEQVNLLEASSLDEMLSELTVRSQAQSRMRGRLYSG